MINYTGILKVRKGTRQEFFDKIAESGVIDMFRAQKGNVFYEVAAALDDPDKVIVTDGWEDEEAFQIHNEDPALDNIWRPISRAYVEEKTAYHLITWSDYNK